MGQTQLTAVHLTTWLAIRTCSLSNRKNGTLLWLGWHHWLTGEYFACVHVCVSFHAKFRAQNVSFDQTQVLMCVFIISLRPRSQNVLYISFDQRVCISAIRLWNYSKTPERGAADVAIWCDGMLIASCELQPAETSMKHQSILFTCDQRLLSSEQAQVSAHLYSGPTAFENSITIGTAGVVLREKGASCVVH